MALIDFSQCGKQVSDKATSCPCTTTVYQYPPKRNTYKINSISDILKDNRGNNN